MNFLQRLLDATGIADLLKPRIDDEAERKAVVEWINHYLTTVLESIEDDIDTEKKGFFAHLDNQHSRNEKTKSLGYVQYVIKDKYGSRLELSQFSLVSCNSIKMTENYMKLKAITDEKGYAIELKEINIDGDGVDTYEELDDYLDDFERYLVITVSGW